MNDIPLKYSADSMSNAKHAKTLAKAQCTQGIEYFDSINNFRSEQKLQQALNSWSNFSLVLYNKGREIRVTTLTNPCKNFIKFNNLIQFNISEERLRELSIFAHQGHINEVSTTGQPG